jgi:hypothetical protein
MVTTGYFLKLMAEAISVRPVSTFISLALLVVVLVVVNLAGRAIAGAAAFPFAGRVAFVLFLPAVAAISTFHISDLLS